MRRLLRFRDLEYFVAIAERESFAQAADALAVSQPTLSNQMRKFEEALGCRVFTRQGRGARLTPEGERALVHARSILQAFADFDRAVRGDEDFVGRRLRFGAIPTVAPYLGPPLLKRLCAENPDGETAFVEGLTEDLEAQVASGALDFAISATAPKDPALRARRVGLERLVYVSARPIPADPFRDAAPRPMLLMQEGHCLRDQVFEALTRRNARLVTALNYAISPSSLATLAALIRGGVGDALFPEPFLHAAPSLFEGLAQRRLPAARFERGVQLVARAAREDHRDIRRLSDIVAETHAALLSGPRSQAAPPEPEPETELETGGQVSG